MSFDPSPTDGTEIVAPATCAQRWFKRSVSFSSARNVSLNRASL